MKTNQTASNTCNRAGFSLVELSVVLVIIGLVVGGILVGQSILKSTRLNNAASEITKYRMAIETFQVEYTAMPGDMSNATKFWGAASNCPGTASSPPAADKTCNGDGDGYIEDLVLVSNGTSHEVFQVWHHLNLAGLTSSVLTTPGVPAAAYAFDGRPGVNIPASSIEGAGYMALRMLNWWNFGQPGDEHVMFLSGPWTSGVLTPLEAKNIDQKLDDGRPGTGFITTYEGECTTTNDAYTAEYALSYEAKDCLLIIDF